MTVIMDRIILTLLLIFTLSGQFLCAVEDQNMILLNKSEEFSTLEAEKLAYNEDFTNGAVEISQNKRFADNNSIAEKNLTNSYSYENDGKNVSTKADEINVIKLNTSDIDYGGYNLQNSSKSFEKSNEIPEVSKELYKLGNESITLSAESLDTTIKLHHANTSAAEVSTSNVASDILNETTFSAVNISSVDSESSTKNYVHSDISIFSTLDAAESTNTVESTLSHTVENTQKKVSASPKSATKKRSLNNTNSESSSADFISTTAFTDYASDTEKQTSSKLYDISTTLKYKPDLEIEELPSPLPFESLKNENEQPTVSFHTLSYEDSTASIEDLNNFKVISVNQAISPQTFSLAKSNTESIRHFNESENMTESESSEITSSEESLEREHILNSEIESQLPKQKYSFGSKSFLPHVNDDIIYAGFADDEHLGVTFDPDGMKNNLPQDPDSIIFSVTPIHSAMKPFEKLTESNNSESETEANKSSNMELLPHEGPETEFEMADREKISHVNENDSLESNESKSLVQPEIIFVNTLPTMKESEIMLQDAPPIDINDKNHSHIMMPSNSNAKIVPKEEKDAAEVVVTPKNIDNLPTVTKNLINIPDTPITESLNKFNQPLTEQSVIRPVKILSPTFNGTVPTFLNSTFLPQSSELSTESVTSDSSTNLSISTLENSQTSSPTVILNQMLNGSTSFVAVEPELVGLLSDKNKFENKSTEITEINSNSTIAGVAIKTSVSVSLPLSKQVNGTMQNQNFSSNSSLEDKEIVHLLNQTSENASVNDTTSPLLETSIDTSTSPPSTTTVGAKIRKPGIRIPGASKGDSPRTRKPFIPALTKPATTVGPPVSIFKKERTRANSITSSTTRRPFQKFSTIRIDYASHLPPGILPEGFYVSVEPTEPTTTTTEEPISEVPFTDQTYVPSLANEDDVTLIKVGGGIVLDRGFKWMDQLRNRHSPEYKEKANQMHLHLERLFRSSPIASRLWRIEIDGFNGTRNSRSVEVDFILYLIKSPDRVATEHLATVFHEKLTPNNTFATYRVDPSRTAFELLQEEPLNKPTPASTEDQYEPPVPQWAIAVIVICAASLIFIVLFAAVTMYGRHHMRRRYGNKLNEDDLDRSSGEWESKMTAAYENMAADTIYDAEDLRADAYKKPSRIATFHGVPSTLKRCDSWSSGGWSTPPRRKKPTHVH